MFEAAARLGDRGRPAAAHADFSLETLAANLGEADTGLGAFANGDAASDVRLVFSWSYRAVSGQAARLFR